ncbi:MAG: hypothetical protein JXB05_15680 [Myxococcaceae bacterium]|nr:hypothetical protein [Myxococcaceae bacterium]
MGNTASLTYMGLELAGHTALDGVTPARFFTHYFNSSRPSGTAAGLAELCDFLTTWTGGVPS